MRKGGSDLVWVKVSEELRFVGHDPKVDLWIRRWLWVGKRATNGRYDLPRKGGY